LPLLVTAVAWSCVLNERPQEVVAPQVTPVAASKSDATAPVKSEASGGMTTWKVVATAEADAPVLASLTSDVDCDADTPTARVVEAAVTLDATFGAFALVFTVSEATPGQEAVRGSVEERRLTLTPTKPWLAEFTRRLCSEAAADTRRVLADDALVAELRHWLEQTAPDCLEIDAPAAAGAAAPGWRCKLPRAEPASARAELASIQAAMVRRWNRQPYLLARRLAVGSSLAVALATTDDGHALDVFCNVVKHSLPVELPATLSSKRWQTAACGPGDLETRRAAAAMGLAKTVAEIDFLKQLFEKTSKLGHLAVRIPSADAPTRNLLVSLLPEPDVIDNLAKEAATLAEPENGAKDKTDTVRAEARACWHPLYGEDDTLLALARHLALAGDAPQVACDLPASGVASTAAQHWLAESIAGETEFVVTNGRSKTLRLPAGNYRYTLRALPDDPESWDDASQQGPAAAGLITWDARRPRPVISSW
jgi:hypothetical protein